MSIVGLPFSDAHGVEITSLSLDPPQTCKKPPKSPPYKLLHKEFLVVNSSSNYPFNDTVDINGDGWCDWVSMVGGPPHRTDQEIPELEDFIFLGTKSGWKKFGDMQKFRSDSSRASPWHL
jgi:hypothetical protein